MKVFLLRLISLLLLLSAASTVQAKPGLQDTNTFNFYYLNPQPDTISSFIQFVDKNDAAAQSKAFGNVTGFMSEIFRANPGRIDQWLTETPLSKNTQVALVRALWLADMHEFAIQAMRRFHWPENEIDTTTTRLAKVNNLDAIIPNNGNDLDLFWGAFFASGEKRHIERILSAYHDRASNLQIDPLDILLAAEVIGTKTPDPAAIEKMKQLKSKYGEKRSYELIVAATALWGIGANAAQHVRVRDTVVDYLRNSVDNLPPRVLGKYLAESSTNVIGQASAHIMLFTTTDPNFASGPLKDMIEQKKLPRIDKVFTKSTPAFAALAVLLKTDDQLEFQLELIGLKGGVRRSVGKFSGAPDSATIKSAMIPLLPEPDGSLGLHEILLTVSGSAIPKQSFRTMVYFED